MKIELVVTIAAVLGLLVGCPGGDSSGSEAAESATGTESATSTASASSSASASGSSSATTAGSASGSESASSVSVTGDGSTSATASDTGGGCDPSTNSNPDYLCCDGAWIDPRSDLFNCGMCGRACEGDTPFCDQGTCAATPCGGQTCGETETCCGTQCCGADTICCTLNGPVEGGPGCVPPSDDGNCPPGCAPLCRCAAPDTLVATPRGERAIATLAVGDLVYSVDDDEIAIVPIARVQRIPVDDHRVVRAVLDDGRVLRITPTHPLADGRAFGDLRVGQRLGDLAIVELDDVAYDEPFTYDILPLSSTGTYFVAGELVASTMN